METHVQMDDNERALPVNESPQPAFVPVVKSLADLLGSEYTGAAGAGREFFLGADAAAPAAAPVDFSPFFY